ncbi:hypothetical protein [Burkholderia pyrrocinia]|uniref:hypothetical protein n=1 Tax=Burkholderia pyrrocinia TaxID=60550 RepID=UPI002AB2E625|nr:hypothetical protein [Burkholderia pyrrocinia]
MRNAQNLILPGADARGQDVDCMRVRQQACRRGLSVLYVRVARLFEEPRSPTATVVLRGASPSLSRWTSCSEPALESVQDS